MFCYRFYRRSFPKLRSLYHSTSTSGKKFNKNDLKLRLVHIQQTGCFQVRLPFCTLSTRIDDPGVILSNETETPDVNIDRLLEKLDLYLKHYISISVEDVQSALKKLESKEWVFPENGILLLSCCDLILDQPLQVRIDLLWKIWSVLKKRDAINLDVFHTFVRGLKTNGDRTTWEKLLNEIGSMKPTIQTYVTLLHYVSENFGLQETSSLFDKLKLISSKITADMISGVIFSYAKSGNIDQAFRLIQDNDISDSSSLYNYILRGIAESSNKELFVATLEKLAKGNTIQKEEDVVALIKSLVKGNLEYLIPKVLNENLNWGPYFPVMFNESISCMYNKNTDAAFVILDNFKQFLTKLQGYGFIPFGEYVAVEMVKSKIPLDLIIEFCDKLVHELPLIYRSIAYASMRYGTFEYTTRLFEKMRDNGYPLRPHYFWPLLVNARKDAEEGIMNVISEMTAMKVVPDHETLLYYVLPFINVFQPKIAVRRLQDNGVPYVNIVTPLLSFLIQQDRIYHATVSYSKMTTKVDFSMLEMPLVEALIRAADIPNTMRLIQLGPEELPNNLLRRLIRTTKRTKTLQPATLKSILNGLSSINAKINWSVLEEVKDYLHAADLSKYENEWLNGLVNNVEYTTKSHLLPEVKDMNLSELENYLTFLESHNRKTRQVLRRLLLIYASTGNVQRAEEVKKKLDDQGYIFSAGMKAALIEMYGKNDDLENGLKLLEDLNTNHPDFQVDGSKYLLLAILCIKKQNFKKALELINKQQPIYGDDDGKLHTRRCVLLLQEVCEQFDTESAKLLLDILIKKNFCKEVMPVLRVIVQSYLSNNEIEKATEEALYYANKNRLIPNNYELMSKLVNLCKEEQISGKSRKYSNLLDNLLQVSSYVYGASRTNMTYVSVLAENNLLETLKEYLQGSFTGIDNSYLWKECNILADKNQLQVLLNLEKSFKSLTHFNMEPIYMSILRVYSRTGDVKSAEQLLCDIEEGGRIPSAQFMRTLNSIQQSNNSNNIQNEYKS